VFQACLSAQKGETMDTGVRDFHIEFENYDFGVRRIIPWTVTSPDDIDDAFSDELDSLLYARDCLEEELQAHPDSEELAPYIDKIKELDFILHAKRHVVLQIIANYPQWRETLKERPPRSHWWWYLDQLNGDGYETEREVVSWPAEQLGIVFGEEIAARVGLKAGQRVTIRVPDDKHIVISVQRGRDQE